MSHPATHGAAPTWQRGRAHIKSAPSRTHRGRSHFPTSSQLLPFQFLGNIARCASATTGTRTPVVAAPTLRGAQPSPPSPASSDKSFLVRFGRQGFGWSGIEGTGDWGIRFLIRGSGCRIDVVGLGFGGGLGRDDRFLHRSVRLPLGWASISGASFYRVVSGFLPFLRGSGLPIRFLTSFLVVLIECCVRVLDLGCRVCCDRIITLCSILIFVLVHLDCSTVLAKLVPILGRFSKWDFCMFGFSFLGPFYFKDRCLAYVLCELLIQLRESFFSFLVRMQTESVLI
jgi:hypothetical protein